MTHIIGKDHNRNEGLTSKVIGYRSAYNNYIRVLLSIITRKERIYVQLKNGESGCLDKGYVWLIRHLLTQE